MWLGGANKRLSVQKPKGYTSTLLSDYSWLRREAWQWEAAIAASRRPRDWFKGETKRYNPLIGELSGFAGTRWIALEGVVYPRYNRVADMYSHREKLAAAQRLIAEELSQTVGELRLDPDDVLPRLDALFVPPTILTGRPYDALWLPDTSVAMPGPYGVQGGDYLSRTEA